MNPFEKVWKEQPSQNETVAPDEGPREIVDHNWSLGETITALHAVNEAMAPSRPLCSKGCCFECETCAAKTGMPALCAECLMRRRLCDTTVANSAGEVLEPQPTAILSVTDIDAVLASAKKMDGDAYRQAFEASPLSLQDALNAQLPEIENVGKPEDPLNSRRLRCYVLSKWAMVDLFSAPGLTIKGWDVPEGAKLLDVNYDWASNCFLFKFYHPSFKEVPDGGEIERQLTLLRLQDDKDKHVQICRTIAERAERKWKALEKACGENSLETLTTLAEANGARECLNAIQG